MDFKKLVSTPIIKAEQPKYPYTTTYDPFGSFGIVGKIADDILKCADKELNYLLNVAPYFRIKKVIFNNPATIVYWSDGDKTVVKCGKDDTYSEETGLALCFMKKALGNKGNYNNTFKKYIKEKNNGKDNDN
jgi:hypothetical protein